MQSSMWSKLDLKIVELQDQVEKFEAKNGHLNSILSGLEEDNQKLEQEIFDLKQHQAQTFSEKKKLVEEN